MPDSSLHDPSVRPPIPPRSARRTIKRYCVGGCLIFLGITLWMGIAFTALPLPEPMWPLSLLLIVMGFVACKTL